MNKVDHATELANRLADLFQQFGRFQHRLDIKDDEVATIMDEMIELQWLADYCAGHCSHAQLEEHFAVMAKPK